MTNASNRKDIRRLEKQSASADRQRREMLGAIMDTTAGRAYIWSELSAAHVFSTSFSESLAQMAFLEGERNMGLRLLNDVMESAPDQFILMLREQNARDYSREQPGSQNGDGDFGGPDSEADGGDGTGWGRNGSEANN